jgi:benzoyl-CoA reductase/2-hydroxyglutaryl-CoA dehydratase subunit BcrC/BadD/HgdB
MFRSYSRAPDVWSDVGDYYVRFYRDHFPCTTLLYTADSRAAAVAGLLSERNADAFIFAGEKFCEYEYFELPFLEGMFKESGTPVLSLEISIEDDSTAETFRTRIEAFAEMLAARTGG